MRANLLLEDSLSLERGALLVLDAHLTLVRIPERLPIRHSKDVVRLDTATVATVAWNGRTQHQSLLLVHVVAKELVRCIYQCLLGPVSLGHFLLSVHEELLLAGVEVLLSHHGVLLGRVHAEELAHG